MKTKAAAFVITGWTASRSHTTPCCRSKRQWSLPICAALEDDLFSEPEQEEMVSDGAPLDAGAAGQEGEEDDFFAQLERELCDELLGLEEEPVKSIDDDDDIREKAVRLPEKFQVETVDGSTKFVYALNLNRNPEEFPLRQPIVLAQEENDSVKVAVFQDQYHLVQDDVLDVQFLQSLKLDVVAYGAADYPIFPFMVDVQTRNSLRTARDIIEALRPKHFESEHIDSLDETELGYKGYNPGTKNDEIHNDAQNQKMFWNDKDMERCLDENGFESISVQGHNALKAYVRNGKLWYALLHTTKSKDGHSDVVVLFAVGVSSSNRLVGAVSCQVCHNLCD